MTVDTSLIPYSPMPEVTRVEYVATYEMVTDRESTTEEDQTFLSEFEKALQSFFPNAELYLYLDGEQYTTRATRVWVQSPDDDTYDDDNTPAEIVQEVESLCNDVAMTVGAYAFPPETVEGEEGEEEATWRYAVRVMEDTTQLHNESADNYVSAYNRAYDLREAYTRDCRIIVIDGSDFGVVFSTRGMLSPYDEPSEPDSWEDGSDQPMPWELADDEKY